MRAALGIGCRHPRQQQLWRHLPRLQHHQPESDTSVRRGKQTFDYLNNEIFAPLYLAAVESFDEAIINSMLATKDAPTQRPGGHMYKATFPKTLMK